ncbi:MAG: phosphoribosylformylglycinamidine synthase I [Candidatus Gastranaerophilales bacterium]|nr:phosphoribosylformylglycinamidine synthase I [Candidatus Gastranaerophilales bacterium]
MKVGIITFPGSNCDMDTKRACEYFGWEVELVSYNQKIENDYNIVFLPGGFSYGDYVSAGRLAKYSVAVSSLENFNGLIVGICNGFQILCEKGFLPGSLQINDSLKFICKNAAMQFNNKSIILPVAHKEGRFWANDEDLAVIKEKNMDFIKYSENINGSVENIAGIYDRENKIIGLMPHPERAIFEQTGSIEGRLFFEFLDQEVKRAN